MSLPQAVALANTRLTYTKLLTGVQFNMPRLLLCKSCGVLHNMRDYEGTAKYDMELIETINRHLGQAADPRPESHVSMIIRCDEATSSKLDMETAVKKELMDNEIEVRAIRDDLKEDALKCFSKHSRPKAGCIDWQDESKTVGRKTGVPKKHRQYLCMYCPANEHYVYNSRKELGLYSTKHDTVASETMVNGPVGRKPKGAGKSKLWTPPKG